MRHNRPLLREGGLPGIVDLGQAETIVRIALGELSADERAKFRSVRLEP
jgi:hypothetical protein